MCEGIGVGFVCDHAHMHAQRSEVDMGCAVVLYFIMVFLLSSFSFSVSKILSWNLR